MITPGYPKVEIFNLQKLLKVQLKPKKKKVIKPTQSMSVSPEYRFVNLSQNCHLLITKKNVDLGRF